MSEEATDESSEDAFCGLLGITFASTADGSATATMPVMGDHLNFAGKLHGGAAFALADAAAGVAMESALDEETGTALEANVSFLSAVSEVTSSAQLRS